MEIDLGTQQQEYEQPHDESGRHDKVIEFLCLSLRHLEPERILVSNHDAEHKNGHEAARLQAVGREIGADHHHERHDRRIFRKEGQTFVRD